MKNQINIFLDKRTHSSPAGQTFNRFEMEVTPPGKLVNSMGYKFSNPSLSLVNKIISFCGVVWKVKRKYFQEKHSKNYWNSIN